MTQHSQLDRPWLVAVWPGMGHVALGAGYYLMSKLGMTQFAELPPDSFFDVDAAIVTEGLVQKPQRPRSRLFAWKAPEGQRDVIVFIGESQPTMGKFAFCTQLAAFARDLNVERLFTFAAMATDMQPGEEGRVFVAATQQPLLDELKQGGVHLFEEGQIGGLNGVLLAAAAEMEIPGVCLLGEMPHIFTQLLYPKASLAVLRVFVEMAGVELDMAELAQHAEATEHRLGQWISEVQRRLQEAENRQEGDDSDEMMEDQWKSNRSISAEDEEQIERLFEVAKQDRARAFELKSKLDQLGVFDEFEDRFLDLFKKES